MCLYGCAGCVALLNSMDDLLFLTQGTSCRLPKVPARHYSPSPYTDLQCAKAPVIDQVNLEIIIKPTITKYIRKQNDEKYYRVVSAVHQRVITVGPINAESKGVL